VDIHEHGVRGIRTEDRVSRAKYQVINLKNRLIFLRNRVEGEILVFDWI
jgi:hypothetical protein